jgi:Flp pilus assembly protein TadG
MWPDRLRKQRGLRSLLRDRAGNSAVAFALTAPVLFGLGGLAIDYAGAVSVRAKMQAVADAAAIQAAREFQMAQSSAQKIATIARNYVTSQLTGVGVTTEVDAPALKVRVKLEKDVELTLAKVLLNSVMHVSVTATAKMTSGLPLCLLALEPRWRGAVTLQTNARMTAPACIVQSNSTNPQGLVSMDDALLQAGFICSSGGRIRTKNTNYTPEPITDCPVMADPLAARQGPTDFACSTINKVVDGTVTSLQPGVYCGGLKVTNAAEVTLYPGIYVFKDGPLVVDGGATLKGTGVAIYMKGPGANLTFDVASTISLAAPTSGPLTGILIYDDPTGAAAPDKRNKRPKENAAPREHLILSDNARTLLGTIYMPKGRLIVDATKPVADRSAYTVMVVQQLDLYDGPNLHLNTDYQNSDVPVPQGVGPYGGKVLLTN